MILYKWLNAALRLKLLLTIRTLALKVGGLHFHSSLDFVVPGAGEQHVGGGEASQ